jgi:signal transduction histidine kinase
LAQPRVLIVDEPEERLASHRGVIGELAAISVCAATGDLTASLQDGYAVIVLNVTAPGGAGLAAVTRIRQHPGTRRTPLLLIGPAAAQPQLAGIVGPVDFLPVPVPAADLRAKVRLFVDLQRAAAELAQLNERFLSIMLHELRTPLNAILGWTTLLRTGRVDTPTTERALETIERNARAQTHLIEELQDVSRIVAGEVQLELADVDPRKVAEAALAAMTPAADARQVTLIGELEGQAVSMRADPARLQQVLGNLLANAIRFTPEGGEVTLRLTCGAGALQVSVADNGCGIAPELVPQLFDRFRQDEGTAGRRRSGRGLGLTIVRRLVDLHGGTVSADSPGEGQGATFTVRIPTGVSALPAAVRS